jgi:hypothetical protein
VASPATYENLVKVPDHRMAEIVDGELLGGHDRRSAIGVGPAALRGSDEGFVFRGDGRRREK